MGELSSKHVKVVGVGALGCVIAHHLASLGVGQLTLIDRDIVEWTNLQRQLLFDESDARIGKPKAIAAVEKLKSIYPSLNAHAIVTNLHSGNVEELLKDSDLILDGTDNMFTRFLINDVSVKHNIPWIYGGAISARGVVGAFYPGVTPCFRCLFYEPAQFHGQTCDTVGVLAPLVNIVAAYQVTLANKVCSIKPKQGLPFMHIDIWTNEFEDLSFMQTINPECPCCQQRTYSYLNEYRPQSLCTQLCGRDSVQISPVQSHTLSLHEWTRKWKPFGEVIQSPFHIKLIFNEYTIILFKDGRMLITGTNDEQIARKLYEQLTGT